LTREVGNGEALGGTPPGISGSKLRPSPRLRPLYLHKPNITQAKFYLANIDATRTFGCSLGQIVEPETVIALSGQMGSGKTTLVQAVAKGLQVEELVVSPTFVMINEFHSGRLPLFHLDLYRFLVGADFVPPASIDEPSISFLISQLEEILQTKAVVIVEWAQVLINQFGLDLNNLCQNGYLSLDLQVDPNNDQARFAILTTTDNKDEQCSSLFSDLCELSKKFLSN
jgi:tRNA threonylcarbamoyladenosine biosynthesis protein TsaE